MAISLNCVVGFNFKLQAKCQHVSRSIVGASAIKANPITFSLQMYGFGGCIQPKRWGLCLSVADSDRLAMNSTIKGSGDAEGPVSDDQVSAVNTPSLDSHTNVDNESHSQISEASNGSMVSPKSTTKKVPLTAKERLRAARVLSRYAESKPSKTEMGSKVLDAMRESDKGKKRSRLPEAPTNLFDDSKRGLPKQGLTFQFPGGIIDAQMLRGKDFTFDEPFIHECTKSCVVDVYYQMPVPNLSGLDLEPFLISQMKFKVLGYDDGFGIEVNIIPGSLSELKLPFTWLRMEDMELTHPILALSNLLVFSNLSA
ncbi:hypothetical protein PTKIN_Ptkin01aG0142100 [Pterospermum kingtungense]